MHSCVRFWQCRLPAPGPNRETRPGRAARYQIAAQRLARIVVDDHFLQHVTIIPEGGALRQFDTVDAEIVAPDPKDRNGGGFAAKANTVGRADFRTDAVDEALLRQGISIGRYQSANAVDGVVEEVSPRIDTHHIGAKTLDIFSMRCLAPSHSATTETTAAIPKMMPVMISAVRKWWAFIAFSAMCRDSRVRSDRRFQPLCRLRFGGGNNGTGTGLRPLSAMISPSRRSRMRCACCATFISWVTITTV